MTSWQNVHKVNTFSQHSRVTMEKQNILYDYNNGLSCVPYTSNLYTLHMRDAEALCQFCSTQYKLGKLSEDFSLICFLENYLNWEAGLIFQN